MVADDNDVAQRLCKRVLEKAGYSVLIAGDGLQAVDVALKRQPSMILMDVAMPGIDGLEAMRRIKTEMPTMPIVIASAHSMTSDRERFLARGGETRWRWAVAIEELQLPPRQGCGRWWLARCQRF